MSSQDVNDSCAVGLPTISEFVTVVRTEGVVIGIVILILSLAILGMFIYNVWHRCKAFPNLWHRQGVVWWILGVYTIFAWTSLFGLLFPAAGPLCTFTANIYLAVTMLMFHKKMLQFFNGHTSSMTEILTGQQMFLQLRNPPCCCCCCCLPRLNPTKRNFRFITVLVLQKAIVTPINYFIGAVLWINKVYNPGLIAPGDAFIYIVLINVISTLFGMWGLIVEFRMFRSIMPSGFKLVPKFMVFQVLIILTTLQGAIIGMLSTAGIIKCDTTRPISAALKTQGITFLLTISESFILSIIATVVYRKDSEESLAEWAAEVQQMKHKIDTMQSNGDMELHADEVVINHAADQTLSVEIDNGGFKDKVAAKRN
ncbi:unnamed protein product [Owenia fusiformis]|uniref:Uncharacterized protein n=1 Tax=Owenia fusiformis TaxID=6347 RepID=A0A8J1U4G9_OWEFU|nr:unnamed protein product [Owenia fusiformis]